MQSLRSESNPSPTEDHCARELLDAVPVVMSIIRGKMRQHRSGLTIPQFRTLYFVSTAAGHSLSDVADFIGLSLPAMSRLVDGLVEKRLILRRTCDNDRRHVRLSITPRGQTTLDEARQIALEHLSSSVTELSPQQRTALVEVMYLLRGIFSPDLPSAITKPSQTKELVG